jgi:hypothetical protein
MIDLLRTWLPQIIGYAEVISDDTLQKAWADGDRLSTSAYCSDELHAHVFDDLDADNMLDEARLRLREHPSLVNALDQFLLALRRLDEWIEAHVDTDVWARQEAIPASVRDVFYAQEWRDTLSAAAAVLLAAEQGGFSSEDLDLNAVNGS